MNAIQNPKRAILSKHSPGNQTLVRMRTVPKDEEGLRNQTGTENGEIGSFIIGGNTEPPMVMHNGSFGLDERRSIQSTL